MPLGIKAEIVNKDLVKKDFINFVKQLQDISNNNKIELNIGGFNSNNIKTELGKIKTEFDKSFQSISDTVDGLNKKSITFVDGKATQEVEEFNHSLLETQKIIKTLNKEGEIKSTKTINTSNYAKVAKEQAQANKILLKTEQDIALFRQRQENKISGLQSRYKDLLNVDAIKKYREEMNTLSTKTPDVSYKMKEMGVGLNKIGMEAQNSKKALDLANKSAMSFGESVKLILLKFSEWYILGNIFMVIPHFIQNNIEYIKQMDTAVTDLSKVVELSVTQLEQMKDVSIELGKALGQSSVAIMQGMAEFGRITKNQEEIVELTRVAGMASNVTTLSAQEAAKALTSTMITFGIAAEDSMMILDSWNEIQNNFRVSAEDLADSIGKIGAASKVAKTDMQNLEGIVTSIIQTTGISGSEAGTAVKSWMSRIYRTDESDPEQLGKTAEALKEIADIDINDSNGQMKSFNSLLDEINIKWQDMSEQQKMATAQTIGSTYHYSKFIALMDNYGIKVDATKKAYESQNSALVENAKYLDSINGRIQILGTTIQETYNQILSSDFFKLVVSESTELVDAINNTIKTFGMAEISIYTFISALTILKGKVLVEAITKVGGLGAALTALAANPMTWVILGLGALTVALVKYADETQKAKKKTEDIKTTYDEFNKSLNSGKIDNVTASLKKLTDTVDYEGATAKIAALNDEIERLQNGGTNGRGRGSSLSDRQRGRQLALEMQRDALQEQVDLVDNATAKADYLDLLREKNAKRKSTNTSKTKTGSDSISSKYTSKSDISESLIEADRYAFLNAEIERTNNLLAKNKALQENTDGEKRVELLKEEQELLKQKQQNLASINEERRQEREELVKNLQQQGVLFEGQGDLINAKNAELILQKKIDEVNAHRNDKDKSTYNKLKEEYEDLNNQLKRFLELQTKDIPQASIEWWNLQKAIGNVDEALKKVGEEQRKNLEDVQKQIVEVIKKRYEIEKDEVEEAHKKKLEQLDDELDTYKENVDSQIKEIDRLRDKEDFDKNQQKTTDKIAELLNERNTLSMAAASGDLTAIERIKEIDEDLAEEREKLSELQQDREDELRKQNLQDDLDAKEKQIKNAKDAADDEWEIIKDKYENLLQEGNLYAEANKALTEGMVIDINGKLVTVAEAFKSFSDQFGQTLGTLGKNIQTEFINKLNQAQQLINTMSSLSANTDISSTSTTPKINSSILSSIDLSSILSKINISSMIPNFTIPKVSALGDNNGSNITLGDIILNITGNPDRNMISTIVNEVAKAQRRELNMAGIIKK